MRTILTLGAAAAALSACATTSGSGPEWREVHRTEGRNAFFVTDIAREGDIASFQLAQVFQVNTFQMDGVYGRNQLWPTVRANCEDWTIAMGPRTRWAEDGSVMLEDDATTFESINWGLPAESAANAACKGEFPDNSLTVRGGEAELIAAARADLGVEQAD